MTQTDTAAAAPEYQATTPALVRRLAREYVRPHLWRIAAAIVCMVIVAASTAAFTQLIKPIVDDVFVRRDSTMLWPVAAFALTAFAAKGFASFGQGVLMSYVGHKIVAEMQERLYGRLIGADLAFFNRTSPGDLIARFVNDLNLLRSAVSNTLVGFGKDLLTALALIGVMFYEDWVLALAAFLAFPTAILPIIQIGQRMRSVSGRTQAGVGRLTTLLDEGFQGVRYVKAYAMESYEKLRAHEAIGEVFRLNYKAERTRNTLHPIMEMLGGLAVVAVILYGGHQVIAGGKPAGSFFAFIMALLMAYEPIKRLAKLNASLQEGMAAATRLFTLLDMEPEIKDAPAAKPLRVSGGTIRFARVTFSYDADTPAIHDVSLEAPAGKTVALVGPSGAGKSTVMNLIPRFYDVDSGSVQIDGQDVRDVTLDSLRRHVALVSQEILLFDDTVRANIAYGRPEASEPEISAAAAAAGAAEFIAELPEGYNTLVGPRGSRLSGGQRQRIAIARAMLKNAPILLLDEATSSLDSESERHVQNALSELMQGRTTLVIAHRLSTVVDADIIYVMDAGRVVESGHHAELLAQGGAYAKLHAMQFADDAGESSTADTGAAGDAAPDPSVRRVSAHG